QHLGTLADQSLKLDFLQPQLFDFARKNERPHLQKPEVSRIAWLLRQPRRKLDFDRTSKGVLSHLCKVIEQWSQRKDIVLEDGSKADQPAACAAHAVVYHVIVRRVGRRDRIQRAISLRGIET